MRPGRALASTAPAIAALAGAALARRVFAGLAASDVAPTLTRALPGPLARLAPALVGHAGLAGAAFGFALAAIGGGALALVPDRTPSAPGVRTGLAAAWLGSTLVSLTALATRQFGVKTGMAALGYAAGWPALLSLALVALGRGTSRLAVVAVFSLGALAGLLVRVLPLGWPGENSWSWWAMLPHVPRARLLAGLAQSAAACAALLAVPPLARARRTLAALALVTLASLLLVRGLADVEHYGPDKASAALASEINTSFLQVAARTAGRPLLRSYADSLAGFPMHARTHPPGWPLAFRTAVRLGGAGSAAASRVALRAVGAEPAAAARLAADVAERPLSPPEQRALGLLTGALLLSLLALPAATWLLARAAGAGEPALGIAGLAALLAAPHLFFPDVDVLYPSCAALAFAAWMASRRRAWLALPAGILVAGLVALSFGNLALLLVAPAEGALSARAPATGAQRLGVRLAGFLAPTLALAVLAQALGLEPLRLWSVAMEQHRLILAHRTFALWAWLDPLDLTLAIGFPLAAWMALATPWRERLAAARRASLAPADALPAAALVVLVLLDLTGRTKGEAARLWMTYVPLLLAGTAALAARLTARAWALLVALSVATLVVLQGFYVFVWLYELH